MKLDHFSIPESLFRPLCRAEDGLSRLDEQVRASPLGAGWGARLDFTEAAAWAWARSELAPIEDLVLHDAHMDVRAPTQELGRAYGLVRSRRKALQGGAELLCPDGALWLVGRASSPPPPRPKRPEPRSSSPASESLGLMGALEARLNPVLAGVSEGSGAGLAEWFEVLEGLDDLGSDLVAAAAALEAWRLITPLPREDYIGAVLAAVWLRSRRRLGSHLLGWHAAAARRPLPSRVAEGPLSGRLAHHLETFAVAADQGIAELRRLTLARQVIARRIIGKRRHSRAGALLDLLLATPLVSAPMAAARLKISQQAVRTLVAELGPSLREVSGRKRFQAWQV